VKRIIAFLLALLLLASCGNFGQTVGSWLGTRDKPSQPPIITDIVCDPSSGSTCTEVTLDNVLAVVLARAAEQPGSAVRVWLQGKDVPTTRMIGAVVSARPRGTGRRAKATYVARWSAEARQKLLSAMRGSAAKHWRRSPIAEALSRVALEGGPAGAEREIIVITDALEVSDFGDFECGGLPSPKKFVATLERNRVLDARSLAGVRVRFCHLDLGAIDRGRCAMTLARAEAVEALWTAAVKAAGTSEVTFDHGALRALTTSTNGKDNCNV
jgi:hypothetical protein